MTRRPFDALQEAPGESLHLRRAQPKSSLLVSLRESFASSPRDPEAWSLLSWEAKPGRVSLWSAPTGAHRVEITPDASHRLRWRIGAEFGGPLVMRLSFFAQAELLAEVSLRVNGHTQREQGRDLAFRCARLVGFSVYRVLQDDPELLLLELSNEGQPTSQNAYREASAAPRLVPLLNSPSPLEPRAPAPQSAPLRGPDDSYLVVSWSPSSVLHFYASQELNWEEPASRWRKRHLRESFFDMTRRRLTQQEGTRRLEIPFVAFKKLWLRRKNWGGLHSATLEIVYQDKELILAESAESHDATSPYNALALLATSLGEALGLEVITELIPQHTAFKLLAVSASPALLFAGTDGSRAIAWSPSKLPYHTLTTAKRGAFVGLSAGPPTWMIKDSGELYLLTPPAMSWHELRPLGSRALAAVCQAQGVAVAVGDNGSILLKRSGAEWRGVPSTSLPEALRREELIAVCHSRGAFYAGSKQGRVYHSSDGETWRGFAAFSEELSALGASEDGLWVGCANGALYHSTSGRSFEQLFSPGRSRIHAICAGPRRSIYAVGEGGALWYASNGHNFVELSVETKIELACARITRDAAPPEPGGALPQVELSWHRTPQPLLLLWSNLSWYGAHYHGGFLYVVGEQGILLRIEAR